ncbi:protein translocase subunit SecD [Pseudoclavibacter sp. RFBA6]|uniref:protein translocase subunit SecD n=1 Tax=Pseudoclavibacter sp. RFBA6 TaxID=2080573 RepID=UPI0021574016|nr:protein translocase subunit SecD [Pseudoclavibacter sp. RFBA6]
MAKSTTSSARRGRGAGIVQRAWRTLTWLLILILALVGLNWLAVATQGGQWTPRLALDLEGGTQVVLAAQLPEGQADPSSEQMQQAVSIIRQRIDASGVSEAEITTQGGRNIVVSVPGEMDQLTRDRIENSAKLEFRAVLVADQAANTQAIPADQLPEELSTTPTAEPTDASDLNWVTEQMYVDFLQFNCADLAPAADIDPTQPLITCDDTGTEKYVLGPVEVTGERIADATSGLTTTSTGATTNQWAVNIEFDAQGTQEFAAVTERLVGLTENQNRFAVTLDNQVIVAPTTNAAITDGKPQISGNFNEESAKALADQLKFGALPFNFVAQSTSTISATLGSSQLVNGLIAGLIGLAAVVVYSLFQYRTLGLVTVASLVIAAALTYIVVTYLSNQEGYRLSLAGVAGLIVAIGITADSFIVYFERIKDELRDGKGLVSAVEGGWTRAIRTILASDAVNFLVAIVLLFVAVGNVRGFALTLGITTIIDIIVVTLFTHPLMRLLARTSFFADGHPASGLDPRSLGAVYRGRGTFRTPEQKKRGASREATKRQTLAERKAEAAKKGGADDLVSAGTPAAEQTSTTSKGEKA